MEPESDMHEVMFSAVGDMQSAAARNQITVVVNEYYDGISRNQVYEAAEVYLATKISPNNQRFKVGKTPKQKSLNIGVEKREEILDRFDYDIGLKWRFMSMPQSQHGHVNEIRFFELTFDKKFRDRVLNEYLPFVLAKAKEIKDNVDKAVKLYTMDRVYDSDDGYVGGGLWGSITLDHPATFDTLAMDPELKKAIIDDLERFLKRKDFYKKVGKAWKRGYLLYGPPGTGKSSLIAAMANYLKFDVYDLELTSLYCDSQLRSILVSTTNRSILVIEDVDCSVEMQDRHHKLTLSGLLNFLDGLWSSCGDERIIIFTTNHKDKLDPALLRPGRMDMHIHMSYCTGQGFKILASNYLGIHCHDHVLCGEIEGLIESVEVTPAEVAEKLMKSEDADIALEGVVNFLKGKQMEANEIEEDKSDKLKEGKTCNSFVCIDDEIYDHGKIMTLRDENLELKEKLKENDAVNRMVKKLEEEMETEIKDHERTLEDYEKMEMKLQGLESKLKEDYKFKQHGVGESLICLALILLAFVGLANMIIQLKNFF